MAKKKAAAKPAEPKQLAPEQLLALNRITTKTLIDAARKKVKDGEQYAVDFGVRVSGQVIVGHPGSFRGNDAPTDLELAQVLLAQFGPRKRKAIVQQIIKTGVRTIIAPDAEPVEGLEELAQELKDGLTKPFTGKRRGAVTGDVEVQLVEWT